MNAPVRSSSVVTEQSSGCGCLLPPLIAIGVAAFFFRDGLPASIDEGKTELIVVSIVGLIAMIVVLTTVARRIRPAVSALPDAMEAMRESSRSVVSTTVRTSSGRAGGAKRGCTGGFVFGVFLLAGLAFLTPFLFMLWGLIDSRGWEPATCTVLSSAVESHSGDDSTTYSIEIRYRYHRDGIERTGDRYNFSFGSSSGYDGKAEVVARYPVGAEVECWIDPDQPDRAVLSRSVGWEILFIFLPLVFVAIGLGGVIFSFVARRS